MKRNALVLGVDGGATKTVGLIVDQNEHVLVRRQVGATNQNVVGFDVAAESLAQVVVLCCRDAGCAPGDLSAIVLGLAGAGGETERLRLQEAVNLRIMGEGEKALPIVIESDARIALEGAFVGTPGIVLIAGTGSVIIGKTPRGEIIRGGGWGRILGDEGSGFGIGRDALKAVTCDYDGRGDAGTLRRMLATTYGWDTGDKIIAAVYQKHFDIASLAPLVLEAAPTDPVCARILQTAAAQLSEQTRTIVKAMGDMVTIGLVMYGSLVDHDTAYARILQRELRTLYPQVEIRPALQPAVHGAILMALQRIRKA